MLLMHKKKRKCHYRKLVSVTSQVTLMYFANAIDEIN